MRVLPFERESAYVLEEHGAEADAPRWILLTPTALEHAAWRDEFAPLGLGPDAAMPPFWRGQLALLERFIARVEGLTDGANPISAGEPDSAGRTVFLDRLPATWRDELAIAIAQRIILGGAEKKLFGSPPDLSVTVTGGADAVVTAETPTP